MIFPAFIRLRLCAIWVVLAWAPDQVGAQVWKFDQRFKPAILRDGMSINAAARQLDGKIVVAGDFVEIAGVFRNRIARLNPDGSLDETFDPRSGVAGGAVFSLGLTPDNKVILGGSFFEMDGVRRPHLARLLTDGQLDATFDPAGPNGAVRQLAVQPDGRVVIVGGFSIINGLARSGVARLNTDGSVDAAFDPAGGVGPAGRIEIFLAEAVALQPDGKVLIGGRFNREYGEFFTGVIRFNPDGSLDRGFNSKAEGGSERILAIAAHEDGRIVIAGSFTNVNSLPRRTVARLLPDGSTDPTFQADDIAERSVRAVAVLADGSVLIGGSFSNVAGLPNGGLARLTPSGTLDAGFAPDPTRRRVVSAIIALDKGRMLVGATPLLSVDPAVHALERLESSGATDTAFSYGTARSVGRLFAIAPTPEGKIFLGGTFDSVNGKRRVGLARLHEDGSLDESFDPAAAVTGQFPGVSALALQADGKVVFTTSATQTNGERLLIVARLLADGSADASFQTGEGPDNPVRTLAVTDSQRILVGGDFRKFNRQSVSALVRLLPNGSLDEAFKPSLPTNAIVRAVAPAADGRTVILGHYLDSSPSSRLVRLGPEGAIETTFNSPLPPRTVADFFVTSPAGRILLGGFFWDLPGHAGLRTVVRMTANGEIETALNPGGEAGDRILALAPLPDGGIVFSQNPQVDLHLRRGTVGYVTPDGILVGDALAGAGLSDPVLLLLPRHDGSVVLAGLFSTIRGTPWFGIARAVHGPSATLLQPGRTAPQEFEFLMQGELDRTYRIEASSDLVRWTPLTSLRATTNSVKVHDSEATPTRRFYRAVAQ